MTLEQQEFITQFNNFRAARGASDMECIKGWNPTLATIAQNYANDCMLAYHPTVNSGLACDGPVGQTVFYSPASISATEVVAGISVGGDLYYNHNDNTCEPSATRNCDNYKQVSAINAALRQMSLHTSISTQ